MPLRAKIEHQPQDSLPRTVRQAGGLLLTPGKTVSRLLALLLMQEPQACLLAGGAASVPFCRA